MQLPDDYFTQLPICSLKTINYGGKYIYVYEGWNFNSGNYLFTTDTK